MEFIRKWHCTKTLSLETCVEGRKVYGGPAPEAVKVQMEHLKQFIQEREA